MLLAKHGGGVGIGINQIRPAGAKITGNGTSDGVVPFCKYMIQLYLPLIKDLSEEERHQLISTLNMTILKNGSRLENQKEMSTDSLLTYINARSSVISLCENLAQEIRTLEKSGANSYRNERLLVNLIFYLKEIQISKTHQLTRTMH